MSYKTCDVCGSRIFEHGCVNCNEMDYISMQEEYVAPPFNDGIKSFTSSKPINPNDDETDAQAKRNDEMNSLQRFE